jgi:DNA-binding response OmpR family regulator
MADISCADCFAIMGQPIPEPAAQLIRFGGLTVDLEGRTLRDADGRDLALTRSEFDLLAAFLRLPGRALSRDHLLDTVSGRQRDRFDRSIDMLIGRLRRKIEPDPKAPRF